MTTEKQPFSPEKNKYLKRMERLSTTCSEQAARRRNKKEQARHEQETRQALHRQIEEQGPWRPSYTEEEMKRIDDARAGAGDQSLDALALMTILNARRYMPRRK